MIDLSGRRYDTGVPFAPTPPPVEPAPTVPVPTPGPVAGIGGPGVIQTPEQHQANFLALYNIDPILAYDYTYRSPSAQQWWQGNQEWIVKNFFGGNTQIYNSWLNDSSYNLQNYYTANPGAQSVVDSYAQGKEKPAGFVPGGVASHFEPGKHNPYATSGSYMGSPVPGGTPFGGWPSDPNSIIQREQAPPPGTVPPSYGGTIPREPVIPNVATPTVPGGAQAAGVIPTVTAPSPTSTVNPYSSGTQKGYMYRHPSR
jgi:hypothetical protein